MSTIEVCGRTVDSEAVDLARRCFDFYREHFNPLPSRPDAKRPLLKFRQYWDDPVPADLFDRFPTSNLQVMCGRRWRLLVIDLDGEEAMVRWKVISRGRKLATWMSTSSESSLHIWLRLSSEPARKLGKAFLWRGDGEHSGIERLCDRSLVIAPPSLHPRTGSRYSFLHDTGLVPFIPGETPRRARSSVLPMECPAWVLSIPEVLPPRPTIVSPVCIPVSPRREGALPSRRFTADEVMAAIPDKVGLAREWGVRVTNPRTERGWAECHAFDRKDDHPSAAIHMESGIYVDSGSGARMSFLNLGIAMGVFADFRDAVQRLGERFVR